MLQVRRHLLLLSTGLLLLSAGQRPGVAAQAAAPTAGGAIAPSGARLLGTVIATSEDTLTLKLESGGEVMIAVGPQTRVVRTAPGEKTLAGATMIHLSDLATGDRVLVRAAAGADASHYTATAVIAMKQADIAQVHATQSEDWQKRGVSGVVKSIEPPAAAGGPATITVSSSGRSIQVAVAATTVIRRYAPDSVNFANAKPSTLAEIQPGDELRARGDHSADGSSVAAVEIVAGSFRNIAGTITTMDTAQNTVTIADLSTKKPVTLHLTAETQMRKLPAEMAQRLAARANTPVGTHTPEGGAPGGAGGPSMGARSGSPAGAGRTPEGAGPATAGEGRPHNDPASMLQRAPTVTLAELKKGDALMVVSTQGAAGQPATAITLIAGVEPLLQGSAAASQNLFSASWNISGSSAEAPQ